MHDWQRDLLKTLQGIKPGTMNIYMSGRQVGKSAMAQMWKEVSSMGDRLYSEEASAGVDGRMWYTVRCTKAVANWIREQPGQGTQWENLIDQRWYMYLDMFDVHEEFYMMLKLRWGA